MGFAVGSVIFRASQNCGQRKGKTSVPTEKFMERPNFIGTKKICGRLPLTFSSGKPAPLVATSGRSNFAQKNAPRPGKPPPRLHKKILITECGYAIYDKSKRPGWG